MVDLIKVEVDEKGIFGRNLTDLEKRQIPFATVLAINDTSFQVREQWNKAMPLVFDRPTPLTRNAVLYRKATKANLAADVFLRDEATKGTPPAKYLLTEVEGGPRRQKRSERWLQSRGLMDSGRFAVPGAAAKLDQYGNVKGSEFTRILSFLQAHPDKLSRATDVSRHRRIRKEIKRQGFTTDVFALKKARGKLQPGVYQRFDLGRLGSAVRPILRFVDRVTYRKRYDIFGIARKAFNDRFPQNFRNALERAMATARK
jgi:hypothetical protein